MEMISNSPKIKSNSCALPRANTGIKHLPPLVTMSWTVPIIRNRFYRCLLTMIIIPVNRASLISLFSCMWIP